MEPLTAGRRIFIGNLGEQNISKTQVMEMCARFGKVTDAFLSPKDNPRNAFVTFAESGSAHTAIQTLNHTYVKVSVHNFIS